MTDPEKARQQALAHLVEHYKVTDITPARVRSYDQALSRLPVAVLGPMVQRAIDTRTPRWGDLPTVAELRADAETCRLELVKALGDYGCTDCVGVGSKGWVAVTHPDGVRMARCGCWLRLQAKRAQLEVGSEALALTAPTGDWTGQDGE